MTLEQGLLLIVFIPLVLVVRNRMRMDLAALLMAGLLALMQWLGLGMLGPAGKPGEAIKAFSGFSEPVVITLFSLFVMIYSLERSGATTWLAGHLLRLSGTSTRRMILSLAGATAVLSLFMNNLAAGALILPVAGHLSRQTRVSPAKLLMPVAFGSLLGGMATYFTTANMIVNSLLTLANPGVEPLGVLSFTPTGGLIAIGGLLFIYFFADRLLPDAPQKVDQLSHVTSGLEMEAYYGLGERTWKAHLLPHSPLIGKTVADIQFGERLGITLGAIQRGRASFFVPQAATTIHAGDVLLLVGKPERLAQLVEQDLQISTDAQSEEHLGNLGIQLAELLIAPRSGAINKTLKELNLRKTTGLTALAVRRGGVNYRTDVGDIKLAFGDLVLVIGEPQAMEEMRSSPDFIMLQMAENREKLKVKMAAISAGVLALAIIASIAGMPIHWAMLTGALFVMLTGMVSVTEAYQRMEWPVIFLIAGMFAVSQAMVQTGLADHISRITLAWLTPMGGLGLAGGAFLLSALLAQFMGGQVTILVTAPILLSAAGIMGVNPQAIAVAAAIGCSAAFLTPMAHPINLMVMVPGNYKFSDYVRLGLPLTVLSFVLLLAGMLIFWGVR